ncbi:protease complex subunit PrcB family protein [Mesonia sp. K7]|uniref:protease complex subunit PrcB family protein n=1 Tax=Mesonia sp. K7 TaxID=2218606 RepID=UPI000DA7810B|nr:protease complex subunit PrcB family protein [Mesonia sp. K7]PZD79005.1 hypothetical protein DNG35_03085 [Mesonia sp. K7]
MKKVILALVAILTLACNSNKKSMSQEKSEGQEKAISQENMALISQGDLHGSGEEGIEAQQTVVKSELQWNELLRKMGTVNPVDGNLLETKIDFSKNYAIALFDQVKGSGGHSIFIENVVTGENITVKYKKTSPDGLATSVMTQPYYIALIPKTDKKIVFEEVK